MNKILSCEYEICKKYLQVPIRLPCQKTICKEHIDDHIKYGFDYIYCQFCNKEHSIPENGFPINKDLECILNANMHLNTNHKKAIEKLKKLEKTKETYNFMAEKPHEFIDNYFSEVKNNIELQKDKLKLKIDLITREMICQVENIEMECKNNIKAKTFDTVINTNLDIQINNWKHELRKPKLNSRLLANLQVELDSIEKETKSKLKKLRNLLLSSNEILFEPGQILTNDLFGKLEFNNKTYLGKLISHTDIVRCIELDEKGQRIFSGSDDKTIKIWNSSNFKLLETLKGHRNKIMCLKYIVKTDILISGSLDSRIIVWDLEGKKSKNVFSGHKYGVWCLAPTNSNCLFSGSGDHFIKLWKISNSTCVNTLKGHNDTVRCLILTENSQLISGSNDKTIKIWDLSSLTCFNTLSGHENCIIGLELFLSNQLISVAYDGKIKLWDLLSNECLDTVDNVYSINSIKVLSNDSIIISDSSIYQNIKIYNLITKSCIEKFYAHGDNVNDLLLFDNRSKLVTCSHDKDIKIWNI